MQDNSKPTFFSVRDEWEMFDLAHKLQNIENIAYYVRSENKLYVQMPSQVFVEYIPPMIADSFREEISSFFPYKI